VFGCNLCAAPGPLSGGCFLRYDKGTIRAFFAPQVHFAGASIMKTTMDKE
jgi:hypothetical protein